MASHFIKVKVKSFLKPLQDPYKPWLPAHVWPHLPLFTALSLLQPLATLHSSAAAVFPPVGLCSGSFFYMDHSS